MEKIIIKGGNKLKGTVSVSGAKNSVLPILAATILGDTPSTIGNVPLLKDVLTMKKILISLGATVKDSIGRSGKIAVDPTTIDKYMAPYDLVKTMRASICILGPLLGKYKTARVSLPGGCIIGPRPIDLHLRGFEELGAKIKLEKGYIVATGKHLHGNEIYLGGPFGSSVLATANVMMAAVKAKGTTIIVNAACEPEVVDLADFLIKMGAKIEGAGSHAIKIDGVKKLHGCSYEVIPDRIEVGTFIMAAAVTGGDVKIEGTNPQHLTAVLAKLNKAGIPIEVEDSVIRVKPAGKFKPVDITTLPYPGFPTDLQAQMMSLMAITEGISIITEKIYPERFMHISELSRMGAKIIKEGASAIVNGVKRLSGAPVMASDLRASAALVLAGLVADGETEVQRIYHLDRGYDKIEKKLEALGAKIQRIKE